MRWIRSGGEAAAAGDVGGVVEDAEDHRRPRRIVGDPVAPGLGPCLAVAGQFGIRARGWQTGFGVTGYARFGFVERRFEVTDGLDAALVLVMGA